MPSRFAAHDLPDISPRGESGLNQGPSGSAGGQTSAVAPGQAATTPATLAMSSG